MDDLCTESPEIGDVYAQIGNSEYEPKHFPYTHFLNGEEFDQKMDECDLIIMHGGISTIAAGLKKGKPIIVCPRLALYGEHVDDHQIQLAETFSEMQYILLCEDIQELGNKIIESKTYPFRSFHSCQDQMYTVVDSCLSYIQRHDGT
ncbi:MAG: hypothetical protein LUD72_14330 [Bacteroidales bacterium]|nr:hypothetical protein [Bacteroidales bacterium]